MSNTEICKELQELIDSISETDLANYIPTILAAKEMLTPKSSSKKSTSIAGQISLEEVLASYY